MSKLAAEAADTSRPHWVVTSPELTIFLRKGTAADAATPEEPVAFLFDLTPDDPPSLQVCGPKDSPDHETFDLRLLLSTPAFLRLGGVIENLGACAFHLSSELRSMALALQACELGGERGFHYRSAKAVELLCEVMRLFDEDGLTPMAAGNGLSLADSRRVVAARDYIDKHSHETMTLESIGRACGLSRAKLSRGFRMMFDCTVAEALAERRLLQASRLLRTTDLPVSSIAYKSGYQNNASFARAFGRHFGLAPTSYRSGGLAA